MRHLIRTGGLETYCINYNKKEEEDDLTVDMSDEMLRDRDSQNEQDFVDQSISSQSEQETDGRSSGDDDEDSAVDDSNSEQDREAQGKSKTGSQRKRGGSDETDSVHGEWSGNDLPSPPKIRRITKNTNDSNDPLSPPKIRTKRGISVCLHDMVKGVLLNSASGALRYQRQCLVKYKGVDHGQPLPTKTLPSIFRQHPTPMSNRTLDVLNVVQRKIAITSSVFTRCKTATDKRIVYEPNFRADLIQSLFTSLLLRFTGRTHAFHNFALQMEMEIEIPLINDIEGFLAYMERTVDSKPSGSLSIWTSQQHAMSIPQDIKKFAGFSKFIRSAAKHLPDEVDYLLNKADTSRSEAIIHLRNKLFEWCNNAPHGHLQFLAQQILADVEELFVDPFGPVVAKNVIAGPGGKAGHVMLRNGGSVNSFSNALDVIIKYMVDEAHPIWLELAGYKRIRKGVVVNILNGRPFNATDAEHFLCKAWVAAKLTLGHYRNSLRPNSTKPHCHPMIQEVEDESLSKIMDDIVRAYEECLESNPDDSAEQVTTVLTAPNFCLLPGEIPCTSAI